MELTYILLTSLLFIDTAFLFSGQGHSTQNPNESIHKIEIDTQGPTTVNVQATITNTNTNANANDNSSHNKNTNANSFISSLKNQFATHIYTHIESHMYQFMQIPPSEHARSLAAWINANKTRLIQGTLASAYCGISLALIQGNRYINRSDLWASWKSHMTAEEMQEYAQSELQKSLHEEILKRYLASAPNRLTCYLLFMKAVEQEEKYIQQHLKLAQLIKKSRLMRIFPINDEKIKRAHTTQKRLAFVKHIFVSWAAAQPSLKSR